MLKDLTAPTFEELSLNRHLIFFIVFLLTLVAAVAILPGDPKISKRISTTVINP
jgi:hypothetical protein